MSIPVFFSLKKIEPTSLPNEAIQIFWTFSNWNDFGHRTQLQFLLPGDSEPRNFRLAFIDATYGVDNLPNPFEVIRIALTENEKEFLSSEHLPDFFSMQPDIESYRDIILKFGTDRGNQFLDSMNDVVHARFLGKFEPQRVNVLSSRVFNLSFLRNSESLFAYYNAGSVLAGVKFEDLECADELIDIRFRIPHFKTHHHLKFSFDRNGIIPRQIGILIGKNGTGKSQTLYKIAEFALTGNLELKGKRGERPIISKILAIETPGETHNSFPSTPSDPQIAYERLMPEFSRGAAMGFVTLSELFVQLARTWDRHIGQQSRWEIFCSLIEKIVPIHMLAIGAAHDGSATESPVMLDSLKRGGEQRTLEAMQKLNKRGILLRQVEHDFHPLSSGQVSFIRLAAQLSSTIENGSLILIDEPETHLHPNLITDFVAMLSNVLQLTGSIAIIATHSAYLVREVPRSQVKILREVDGDIQVSAPRLKTFGADVGAISEFVFGDDVINKLVDAVEKRIINSPELATTWLDELRDELSTEAIMHISERLKHHQGKQ